VSTDGFKCYPDAPPEVVGSDRKSVWGIDNLKTICTSHIERFNLSLRTFVKRFSRLSLGFSKKLTNLKAAVALHVFHDNFCRIHSAIRCTPAMRANLTDHIWKAGRSVRVAWSTADAGRYGSSTVSGTAAKRGQSHSRKECPYHSTARRAMMPGGLFHGEGQSMDDQTAVGNTGGGPASPAFLWCTCLCLGVAVTIPALFLAVASGGLGHGHYTFARALFPIPMLLTRLAGDRISAPIIFLACLQFPVYGGLAARSIITSSWRPIIVAVLIHGLAVCAAFSGAIPDFS